MPAAVAPHDRAALLDALRAADLLSAAQYAKAVALTRAGAAADAAAVLVAAGLLTRFQADRLLAGRADGLHLGPYLVLEQVGRGSRSRVYKARHRTMHRVVAVKVLAAALTDTPQHRDAVRAAVRAAGGLTHPNIVTAYDADEVADRFYLVLEFVDGADLGALVRARGPLPVPEACEFVRQVAAGLQHAHERGMAHRDIKPSNLLVTRPTHAALPTVKIADFGLRLAADAAPVELRAQPAAPAKVTTACEFTAPEAASNRADHRSDLYSLGRVFHFLLTGHLGREALPLAQLRPDVPAEVCAIVHKLMAHSPAHRFASAAELLAHLNLACVPVASAVEGAVSFDLPAHPAYPGHDSGFLTGRQARPVFEASPWAEITGGAEAVIDTLPLNLEHTPAPPPYRAPRRAKRKRSNAVPFWMTATMLVSAVLLSLMGIGAVLKTMVK